MFDEENEIQTEYEVSRRGRYDSYVAEIVVYTELYQTQITVYTKKEYMSLNFFRSKKPITEPKTIHSAKSVEHTIREMIIEWELPFYQREIAQQSDSELDIDYAEELKKKRAKLKLEEEPEGLDAVLNDWLEGKFKLTNRGVTPIQKGGYNEKSKQNLKQYQNQKASS